MNDRIRTITTSCLVLRVTCVFLMFAFVRCVYAAPPCVPHSEIVPIRATLASAGFFANLRGAEKSINSRMDTLLNEARDAAHELNIHENMCKHRCASPVVAVLFNSVPNQTLPSYDESPLCQRLFEETSKQPIRYAHRRFASEEKTKSWYHDLTQGDGDDGEDLYRRCPGKCSPSYSSEVYHDGSDFVVSTSIVCGHARDKDDDQYRLSAAIRWICPGEGESRPQNKR